MDVATLVRLGAENVSFGMVITSAAGEPLWANGRLHQLVVGVDGAADAAADLGAVGAAGFPLGPGPDTGLDTGPDAGVTTRVVAWRRGDGRQLWLQVRSSRLPAPDVVAGALVLHEVADVSEAREQQLAARAREVRLSRGQALAQIGIWEWDVATGVVVWSPELLSQFGLGPEASLSYEEYRGLLHPDDVAMIESALAGAMATGEKFSYTHRMFLADRSTERVFECYGEVFSDEAGNPVRVLGTANDVTEHQLRRAELTRLAERDSLTGLANRHAVLLALRTLLAARAPDEPVPAEVTTAGETTDAAGSDPDGGAVLLVDVDHFKAINDAGGHLVGDQVLRRVARLLHDAAGEVATVGRLGGDEFAVVLPHVGARAAAVVADRLRAAVAAAPVPVAGRALPVSVSVGVAAAAPGQDVEDLLGAADVALYRAKRAGRNRSHVADVAAVGGQLLARRASVLDRARAALATGSLALAAQPVVHLPTGTASGHELLVRLDDGLAPPVGPLELLPELERTDLAVKLDQWVLAQAVAVLDAGSARHPGLLLQVNISASTLSEHPDLAGEVLTALRTRRVNPARLGLEVSEAAALAHPDAARRLAEQVTAAGCRFSLDHFGAGYASLVHLQALHCTAVKIAGELVQRLDHDAVPRESAAVVTGAVVAAVHGLGMTAIATHVDRPRLLPALERLGVDCAQGHHVGRPRPLAQLLREGP